MLKAEKLCKTYRKRAEEVRVLTDLDLDVHDGEFLSIVGISGSGKSTLLHLLGTLDKPDRGRSISTAAVSTTCPHENGTAAEWYVRVHFPVLPPSPRTHDAGKCGDAAMIGKSVLELAGATPGARLQAAAMLERVGLSHRFTA